MMRKFRILSLGMVLGLLAWIAPVSVAPAFAGSTTAALSSQTTQQQPSTPGAVPGQEREQEQQQEMEQQEQAQQQQQNQQKQQLLLTGKILKRGSHYVFQDHDSNTTFRITNASKAKRYTGATVKVVCTVNPAAQTIHISKIERAS